MTAQLEWVRQHIINCMHVCWSAENACSRPGGGVEAACGSVQHQPKAVLAPAVLQNCKHLLQRTEYSLRPLLSHGAYWGLWSTFGYLQAARASC